MSPSVAVGVGLIEVKSGVGSAMKAVSARDHALLFVAEDSEIDIAHDSLIEQRNQLED